MSEESKVAIDEAEKAVEQWKVKKLIATLEAARGNGTSMISLIIPPKDQISRVSKMLNDEMGTATNIKSRVNRLSVIGAITSTVQRLKLYNRVPTNGLVVYCGTVVTAEGKEKKINIDFEPFKPINTSLYLCDNKFHTEALNELLESDDKFGFIVMDGNGALFGILSGNTRTVLHKFSVDLPKKHGRGGQSALRFARLRLEKRHNYLRKVAETAVQMFIVNDRPNVAGLILAGSAEFKQKLNQSDLFDIRLQAIVTKVVDVSYGGENGFNQAIELAADSLLNVKFIREKKLLSTYFGEIAKDSQKYCLTPDTPITLADRCERTIVRVQQHDRVLAHYGGVLDERANHAALGLRDQERARNPAPGIVAAGVHALIPRPEPQPCLTLAFADGRSLTCTLNHRVLTATGVYTEAQHLTPGQHKVRASLRGIRAPVDAEDEDEEASWAALSATCRDSDLDSVSSRRHSVSASSQSEWSIESALGSLSSTTVEDRWQLFGFGCLLGACASQLAEKAARVDDIAVTRVNELDREELLAWLSHCQRQSREALRDTCDDSDRLSVPQTVAAAMIEVTRQQCGVVPMCVAEANAPRELRIGFLRGLFGACGAAPVLDGECLSPVSLRLDKHFAHSLLERETLGSVARLLGDLNIKTIVDPAARVLRVEDADTFAATVGFGAASLKELQTQAAAVAKKLSCANQQSDAVTLAEMEAVHLFAPDICPLAFDASFALPIAAIESAGVQRVYDLCVPLASSFVAAGLVVHNCFGVKDTLAALELGAVEELIVWESLDINRFVLRNKETGAESVAYLTEKQEKDASHFKDASGSGAELEVADRLSLLEWLANNFKSFGAKLQFVTNKSQEGSQFVRGFGGIGGLLRYQVDFLTMDAGDEMEDDFI